jgi:tRNA A-37 threonylcarbamoyl transferase component Bud32
MIVEVDEAAREVRKRPSSTEEAERLRQEVRVLEVARHPGVVQLLGYDGEVERLRLVEGEVLANRHLDSDAIARIALAAATTLADLHEIGVFHGAIGGDHILLDRTGSPILCSFGRGGIGGDPSATQAAADVAALAQTLLSVGTTTDRITRVLHAAVVGGTSARRLATLLAPMRQIGRPPPRSARVAVVTLVVAALATTAAVVALVVARPRRAATPGACPTVDRGCRPLALADGVLVTTAGRYRIGRPGDVVVMGRWRCTTAYPALLQPATGQVWAWDTWARAAAPQAGQLVTRLVGARSLAVDPGPAGCDLLVVREGNGATVVVHPADPA